MEKFFKIRLTGEQIKIMVDTWLHFKGKTTNEQPFSEERYFYRTIRSWPGDFFPTEFAAGAEQWPLFDNTDADHGKDKFRKGWFEAKSNSKLSFGEGIVYPPAFATAPHKLVNYLHIYPLFILYKTPLNSAARSGI